MGVGPYQGRVFGHFFDSVFAHYFLARENPHAAVHAVELPKFLLLLSFVYNYPFRWILKLFFASTISLLGFSNKC